MCRLHVDSLIVKNGEYFLKKQTEKTNRGNSHEIPILEVSAYCFSVFFNRTGPGPVKSFGPVI
jgi:hypothetical protein